MEIKCWNQLVILFPDGEFANVSNFFNLLRSEVRPNPSAGTLLELSFLGFALQVQLPRDLDELQYPEAARIEIGVRQIVRTVSAP